MKFGENVRQLRNEGRNSGIDLKGFFVPRCLFCLGLQSQSLNSDLHAYQHNLGRRGMTSSHGAAR